MKSFRPKGENGPPPGDGGRNRAADFRGECRVNETHESRTDPGARLASKGASKEARLCYEDHVLMENLQGHAHHAARGSETTLGDRWTYHPARQIQIVSACAQAS